MVSEMNYIGLNVIHISQTRMADIQKISKMLKGKQCFILLIDYQEIFI